MILSPKDCSVQELLNIVRSKPEFSNVSTLCIKLRNSKTVQHDVFTPDLQGNGGDRWIGVVKGSVIQE